jgi:hypothetical protein
MMVLGDLFQWGVYLEVVRLGERWFGLGPVANRQSRAALCAVVASPGITE